jgi:DNA primase
MNKRIIVPFRHRGQIIGWTGRYAGIPPANIPRYFNSDLPGGYLFNGDVINDRKREYVLVLEGPFDAISIDAVAALGSELNQQQINWLNSTDTEKIIVPDRQRKNQRLIDVALEQNWSVSFPDWEDNIKDAAQATEKYGELYTLSSIINSRTDSPLQIGVKRQLLKG